MEKMEGFMDISKKLLFSLILVSNLLITQIIFAHVVDPIDEPEILTTSSTLHNAFYNQEPTVIMLKSNNCPHCRTMEEDIKPYVKQYPKINFYKATNSQQLQLIPAVKAVDSSIKIPGFPTLIFVYKGKIMDHQIGANADKIKEKITKLATLAKVK